MKQTAISRASLSRSLLHSLEVVKRSPDLRGGRGLRSNSYRIGASPRRRAAAHRLAGARIPHAALSRQPVACPLQPSIEGGTAHADKRAGTADLDVIDQCRVSRAGGFGGGRRGPRDVRAHAPLSERPGPRGDRRHDAVPRPRGALPPLPRARHHAHRIRRRAGGPARREARARDPGGRAAGQGLRVLARSQEPADHHAQSGVRARSCPSAALTGE